MARGRTEVGWADCRMVGLCADVRRLRDKLGCEFPLPRARSTDRQTDRHIHTHTHSGRRAYRDWATEGFVGGTVSPETRCSLVCSAATHFVRHGNPPHRLTQVKLFLALGFPVFFLSTRRQSAVMQPAALRDDLSSGSWTTMALARPSLMASACPVVPPPST